MKRSTVLLVACLASLGAAVGSPAAEPDPERAALLARFERPAFLAPIVGPARRASAKPLGECVTWGPITKETT